MMTDICIMKRTVSPNKITRWLRYVKYEFVCTNAISREDLRFI